MDDKADKDVTMTAVNQQTMKVCAAFVEVRHEKNLHLT